MPVSAARPPTNGYQVDELAVGSATFKPAPPRRARSLTIRAGGEALRVALPA